MKKNKNNKLMKIYYYLLFILKHIKTELLNKIIIYLINKLSYLLLITISSINLHLI